jgi:hypothetical protein
LSNVEKVKESIFKSLQRVWLDVQPSVLVSFDSFAAALFSEIFPGRISLEETALRVSFTEFVNSTFSTTIDEYVKQIKLEIMEVTHLITDSIKSDNSSSSLLEKDLRKKKERALGIMEQSLKKADAFKQELHHLQKDLTHHLKSSREKIQSSLLAESQGEVEARLKESIQTVMLDWADHPRFEKLRGKAEKFFNEQLASAFVTEETKTSSSLKGLGRFLKKSKRVMRSVQLKVSGIRGSSNYGDIINEIFAEESLTSITEAHCASHCDFDKMRAEFNAKFLEEIAKIESEIQVTELRANEEATSLITQQYPGLLDELQSIGQFNSQSL